METRFGYSLAKWEQAKDKAREILNGVARAQTLITYSDLVTQICAIDIGHHDYALHQFLDEISRDDHEHGRGMRSALVVQKGEGIPSGGFFDLAKRLGEDTSDPMEYWVGEVRRVYEDWAP